MTKIKIQDPSEASTEQLQKNIENIKNEMPQYEKHRLHHESLIENNKRRLALMEKMSAISDTNNRAVTPQYEFQKNEEWIKMHSELLQINSAAERKNVQDEIGRLETVLKGVQDELARFNEALPLYEAELAKREAVRGEQDGN
jgi:hypothetical protein